MIDPGWKYEPQPMETFKMIGESKDNWALGGGRVSLGLRCCLLATMGSMAFAAAPNTPVIFEPVADNIELNPIDVHMVSAFSDPDSGDTHAASDYEIWDTTLNQRVWAALNISNFEKIHIHLDGGAFENSLSGASALEFDSDYELRVRHQDNNSNWSGYAVRPFVTGSASDIFPMLTQDVTSSPAPTWVDDNGSAVILPSSGTQPYVHLEAGDGSGTLLEFKGNNGSVNTVTNPVGLADDETVRVIISAGNLSGGLVLDETDITFTDDHGDELSVYLPAVFLSTGESKHYWVSVNGSTYFGTSSQTEPDFSDLARGSPVPWTVFDNNFKVEVVATGFRLPVHIAFVPNPGPNPSDPFYYVTELHQGVKVVKRNGEVSQYVDNLLNFTAKQEFSGAGEVGVTGIAVDPISGDVFVGLMYAPSGSGQDGPWTARVIRLHSNDGGLTATGTPQILIDDAPEQYSWSHVVGAMSIGPDGKLYVPIGEGSFATAAQNLNNYKGKILRINLDGSAPTDNPFYDGSNPTAKRNYIWALGYRNPFGSTWRDTGNALYVVENGPSTDRLSKSGFGHNNIWGTAGDSDGQMFSNAINVWSPAHAPTAMSFIQGSNFNNSGFPANRCGHLFVCESGPTAGIGPWAQGKRIVEFELHPDPNVHFSLAKLSGPTTLVEYTGSGRATALGLAAGPDGLYFTDLYKDFGNPWDAGANVLRVRFRGVGTIAGTVLDTSSSAISGATITTSPGGFTTTSDSNGDFSLANVSTGTYSVTASKSGYTVQTKASIQVVQNDTATVDFTLQSGVTNGTISGTVTDGITGNPISGATVETTTGSFSTTTNTSGGYVLTNVTPGTYTVEVYATSYITAQNSNVVVVAGQDRLANFALQQIQPFTGILNGGFEGGFHNDPNVDHQTGNSWTQFTTAGFSKSGGHAGVKHSGSWSQSFWEGNYTSGVYQQAPNAKVGNRYRASCWIRGADNQLKFHIGLDPTGGTSATSGNIVWSAEMIPGANWATIEVEATASATTVTLFLKVQNINAGNRNSYFDDAAVVDLGPGGPPPATGTIAGVVEDNSSNPINGATVSTNTGGFSAVSASDGSYSIANVTPGTYNVTASKSGFNSATTNSVSVTANQTSTVNYALTTSGGGPTTGTISGTVEDSSSNPIASATVQTGTGGYGTITDSSGNYTLSNVEAGTYSVTASKNGFVASTTNNVTVTASQTTDVDFTLNATSPFDGLDNGDMEGGFTNAPDGDHKKPNDWTVFVQQGSPKHAGYWHPTNPSPDWSFMIYEGGYIAGIYQQAAGTTVGNNYTATAMVKAFNNDVQVWIGICPGGGTNPDNANWIASPVVPGNTWTQISHQVQASATTVTVFVKTRNTNSGNRETWIDNLALINNGPGTPVGQGTITGVVIDDSSNAVNGATVQTATGGFSTTTNSSGVYTLSNVTAGIYNVTASKSGLMSQTLTSVHVVANLTTTADFVLTTAPTSGTISGTVEDDSSNAISGATVSTNTGGHSTTTNGSGAYTLSNVPGGTYTVTASKTGFDNDVAAGVVVTNGQTTTVDFELSETPPPSTNLISNGDFSNGLTGWSVWAERGTITSGVTNGDGHIQSSNFNGGLYQQFNTGGASTVIDITGFWATDPTVANYQWSEILVINGTRQPVNGNDIHSGQSDVVMIYKNDTWTTTGGWSGDMDQTAAVTNNGSFTAAGNVATIILKSGNIGGSNSGTRFDDIVVDEAP